MEYVPWKFDVPLFMTTDLADILLNSLKTSIKAIGNQGLWILALVFGFLIIISVVRSFVSHSEMVDKGVKKRSLSREIYKTDINRNFDNVVEDGLLRKEVALKVKQEFNQRHPVDEFQKRIDKMDFNHSFYQSNSDLELRSMADRMDANHQFHKKYSQLDDEAKKDSFDANHAFHKKHMDLEVRARVDSMEVGHAAEMQFHTENPDAASEKKDLYHDNADKYYAKKIEEEEEKK